MHSKVWAIRTARSEAFKLLLETVTFGWQYTTSYEEHHAPVIDIPNRITYTFRINIDEQPL